MKKSARIQNQSLFSLLLVALVASALSWANLGRADAPPGRYVVSGGTVRDTYTGLVWEQTVASGMTTLTNSASYCKSVTLDNAVWRVPSMKELQTIVDETLVNPAIDSSAFPNTPAGPHWSSSTIAPIGFELWSVDFSNGKSAPLTFASTAYVRCVH